MSQGAGDAMKSETEGTYLPELIAEKEGLAALDKPYVHASRLLNGEIERVQKGSDVNKELEKRYRDIMGLHNIKLSERVLIPAKQHPKFNFVGKLLGPMGNTLKRLQTETGTRMAILGRGCMKDKAKEEEMRNSTEAKYDHLNDELHIQIEVYAPLEEAYCRMGQAVEHVKKYLIPDYNDDICQSQLMEMYLNGGNDVRGMGRGMASPSNQSMNLGRGRGVPPPLLKSPSAARPSPRGGHVPHGPGTMPARGGLQQPVAGRGAAPGWGMRGGSVAPPPIAPHLPPPPVPPMPPTSQAEPSAMSTRGGYGRGAQLPHTYPGIGVPASMPPKPPVEYRDYGYDSYESYAYERDPRDPYAYPEYSYEGYEQEATAPQSTGTETYDYGHGSTAESYPPYGEQRDWVGASRPKAPPSLSARGVYRSHPYPGY